MTDTIPRPLNGHDKPQVSLLKFAPEPPVDTAEPPSLEAVDRPDNPLADWLTVPDVPVLPAWARSAASLRANAAALGRLCAWHASYHSLRLPKYAFRVALLAVKGLARALRGLWPALTAHDRTAAVKALRAQVKAHPEDVDLAVRYALLHRERTLARRARWGAAATAVAAAAVGWYLAPLPVQAGMLAAVALPLAYLGRGEDAQLLDNPTPPLRVDMSAQQLNDALRAAGLLKAGKGDDDGPRVTCVMGPVRDGNGWAVIFDLPKGGGKTAADVLAKRTAIAAELGVDEIRLQTDRTFTPSLMGFFRRRERRRRR